MDTTKNEKEFVGSAGSISPIDTPVPTTMLEVPFAGLNFNGRRTSYADVLRNSINEESNDAVSYAKAMSSKENNKQQKKENNKKTKKYTGNTPLLPNTRGRRSPILRSKPNISGNPALSGAEFNSIMNKHKRYLRLCMKSLSNILENTNWATRSRQLDSLKFQFYMLEGIHKDPGFLEELNLHSGRMLIQGESSKLYPKILQIFDWYKLLYPISVETTNTVSSKEMYQSVCQTSDFSDAHESDAFDVSPEGENLSFESQSGLFSNMFPSVSHSVGLSDKDRASLDAFTEVISKIGTKFESLPSHSEIADRFDSSISSAFGKAIVAVPILGVITYTVIEMYSGYPTSDEGKKHILSLQKKIGAITLSGLILGSLFSEKFRDGLSKMMKQIIDYLTERLNRLKASYDSDEVEIEMDDLGEFTSQSAFPVRLLSDLVAFVIGTAIIGRAPSGKMLKSFFELAKGISAARKGMEAIVSTVLEYIEMAVNYFRDKVLGIGPCRLLMAEDPEVRVFFIASDELIDKYYKGSLPMSASVSMKITDLLVEGSRLLRDTYMLKTEDHVAKALTVNVNELKKIVLVCTTLSPQATEVRRKPLCICLRGPPGTGKSSSMNPLCRQLAPIITEKTRYKTTEGAHAPDFLYARNPGMGYWDGYNGQPVVLFDDFGAAKDVPGGNSDFLEFLRAANVFPWPLDMAELVKKGKYFFTSDLIICSTNEQIFQPGSLNTPEAITRRFDISFDVVPKLKYCRNDDLPDHGSAIWNRRLDHGKLPREGFCPEVYEFHEIKFASGQAQTVIYTGKVYDYDQVSVYLEDSVSKHIDRESHYLQTIKEEIDRKVRDRLDRIESKPVHDLELTNFTSQGEPITPDSEPYRGLTLDDLDSLKPKTSSVIPFTSKLSRQYTTEGREYILRVIEKMGAQNQYSEIFEVLMSASNDLSVDFMRFVDILGSLHYVALQEISKLDFDKELHYFTILCGQISEQDLLEPIIAQPVISKKWTPGLLRADLDGVMRRWGDKIKQIYTEYPVLSAIGSAVTLVGIGASIYGVYSAFSGNNLETQTSSGERSQNKPVFKGNQQQPVKDSVDNFVVQANYDINTDAVVGACMKNNVYEVFLDGDSVRLGLCTFLHSRFMVMPNHFMSAFKYFTGTEDSSKIKVVFKRATTGTEYKLCLSDIEDSVVASRNDLVFIRLNSFPVHRDLTKFIYDGDYTSFTGGVETLLACKRRDSNNVALYMNKSKYFSHANVANLNGSIDVNNVMQYSANTLKGDCGALLLITDKRFRQRKLLGIHIAGDSSRGYGLASLFNSSEISLMREVSDIVSEPPNGLESQSADIHSSGFVHIGNHETQSNVARASSLRKSKLYNTIPEFTAKTFPAKLTLHNYDGVIEDPLRVAQRLYNKKRPFIKQRFLEYAVSCVFYDLNSCDLDLVSHQRSILTIEDAVKGIPGDDFYRSIPRNTSPGFPWVAIHRKTGFNGKQLYFGKGEEYDLDNDYFRQIKTKVGEDISKLSKSVRPDFIYADFPKDERRPRDKVREGKTRMISCADLSNTIIGRMYFMDFIAWITKCKILNGYCPGINCYSEDWDLLARLMQSKGLKVFDADYSKFDCSHTSQIISCIGRFINDWYDDGEVNANIRNTYLVDLYNSRHIIGNEVYEMDGALPSGHPLTTLINCLVNMVLYRMVWGMANGNFRSMETFSDHVYIAVFGDDSIVNVDDISSGFFNQNTVSGFMKCLGYTYTPADKGGDIPPPFVNLSDVTFLKRSFRFNDLTKRYIAPLELDVVLEIMYWTKKGDGCVDVILKDNVNVTILELGLHPKSVYNTWVPRIKRTCLDRFNYTPRNLTYHQALLTVTSMEARW